MTIDDDNDDGWKHACMRGAVVQRERHICWQQCLSGWRKCNTLLLQKQFKSTCNALVADVS